MIRGRDFLLVRRYLESLDGEASARTRTGRAYYAAYLEALAHCETHLGYRRKRGLGDHAAVSQVLGDLRDVGILQMIGGGRGARYQLDPTVTLLTEPKGTRVDSGDRKAVSASPVELSTADSAFNSAGLGTSTIDSPQTLINDPNWTKLQIIARPANSADYIRADERDRIIVRLCQIRPLSLLELTWLLDRNKAYVRTILKSLIQTERLE